MYTTHSTVTHTHTHHTATHNTHKHNYNSENCPEMELVYIFSTASRLKFGRTSNYKASVVTGGFITTLRRFRPKCVLRTRRNCKYEKSSHGAFQTTCTINTVQSRFTRRRQFHHPSPPPDLPHNCFPVQFRLFALKQIRIRFCLGFRFFTNTPPPPPPPHTHTGFDSDVLPKIAPIMKCIDCGSDDLLKTVRLRTNK
jgi:hypothetical protein